MKSQTRTRYFPVLQIQGACCLLWAFPRLGRILPIILDLQEPEEVIKKGLDQEEKMKKLKTKINKMQAELDKLTEELKTLAEG